MRTRKLPNGHLLIPMRAEGPDGTVGDGMVEIDETHPKYATGLADFELGQAVDRARAQRRGSLKPGVQQTGQPAPLPPLLP